MKKIIILVLLPIFLTLFGCSKESPVSGDSNGNMLLDGPQTGYFLTLNIVQHTPDGDVTLVNRGFSTTLRSDQSPTYYFTTESLTPSTFTITRTVTWSNIQDPMRLNATYNISGYYGTKLLEISATTGGYNSAIDTGYLSVGTNYSYNLGVQIITEEDVK